MFVGAAGMKETADHKELLAEASELLAIFAKAAKPPAKTTNANNQSSINQQSALSNQQSPACGVSEGPP